MDEVGDLPVPGESADAAGPSTDGAHVEDFGVTVPVSIETADGRLIGVNFFDQPVDEAGYTDVLVQKEEELTPPAPVMGSAPLPALGAPAHAALPAGLRLVDALSVGAASGPAHPVDPMQGLECDEALESGEELAAALPLPPEFAYLKDQIDDCRRYLQKKRPILKQGPQTRLDLGPPLDGKSHTLVLDLDNTMVHTYRAVEDGSPLASIGNVRPAWDSSASLNFHFAEMDKPVKVEIWFRPGLMEFLSTVSKHYEIIIYSAGAPAYVEAVIRKAVDPDKEYIRHVFASDKVFYYDTRKSRRGGLWEMQGVAALKNIDHFFEGDHPRRRERVVCVDDKVDYFVNHLGNVVSITPFWGEANDKELEKLSGFLMSIVNATDVRDEIKKRCDLPAYVGSQSRYHTSSDTEVSPAQVAAKS